MKYDDDFEYPEGDFIPGIYNYCDRWCERCIFTDKCRTFASEKVFREKFEAGQRIEKSMDENKDFWNTIHKIVEETADLIDEEIPLVKEDTYSFLDDPAFDEDAEEAMKDYEKIRKKAAQQEVSKVALNYEKSVHQWFEARKSLRTIDYDELIKAIRMRYPEISDHSILQQLSNALEVISWYHIQIWIKLQRALSGYFEDLEDNNMEDEYPVNDADGSAFVVLMGIDRSLAAWTFLFQHLLMERESIKPMIQKLRWLGPEVEKIFPKARSFEWPPKWD